MAIIQADEYSLGILNNCVHQFWIHYQRSRRHGFVIEIQQQGFVQISNCFFTGIAKTRHIHIKALSHKMRAFFPNNTF